MNNYLLRPSKDPSRLDKLGSDFIENPKSVSNDEAFELLANLLNVSEEALSYYYQGKRFVPNTKEES